MTDTKRAAWLEARRQGIGGSDAAAVAGLSPWTTPLEVYLDKIGELVGDETPDMRRGTLLEPVVRQMYADATGRFVEVPGEIVRNPEYPFALVNLDGVASGGRVVECKTSRNRAGWGEPGSADIPLPYLCQVQHAMAVAGLKVADVAVLFGTDFEFEIYEVPADAEFIGLLMDCEEAFWACVVKRTPPEPVSAADIVRRWPKSQPFAVRGGRQELRAAAVLAAVKAHIDLLEGFKASAEAILKGAIRDGEALEIDGSIVATWKSAKGPMRFDAKRFQAEYPDLYAQYLTEAASSRRFLLKGGAKCLQSETITLPTMPENLLPAPEAAPA